MSIFITQVKTILMLIGTIFMIIQEISLNLVFLLLLLILWVGPDWNRYIYISFIENISSSLSPWFSNACVVAIAHRNHFFHFLKINLLYLRWSSDKPIVTVPKGVLKLPVTPMLLKRGHKQPSSVKDTWFWLYCKGGSEKLLAWTFKHISWTLQYVPEGILFSRLFEDLVYFSNI